MDLSDEVKDVFHMAVFFLVEFLGLFLVGNLDASLEVADYLFVADFTGLIELVWDNEGEPGFGETA